MNTFLWSCVAFVSLLVSVESLSCYTCSSSILGLCTSSQQVTCTGGQTSCYSGVASLTGIAEQLHSKGCIEEGNCNNSVTPIFSNNNINLTVSMSCCTANLCNRAGPGLRPLPLGSAFGVLLLALSMNVGL